MIKTKNIFLNRQFQEPIIYEFISPNFSDIILDAGCGTGYFSYQLSKKVKEVYGLDLFIDDLNFIYYDINNLHFINGDIQDMPFPDSFFDKILISSVLQIVSNDIQVLQECRRVLKKMGKLFYLFRVTLLYFITYIKIEFYIIYLFIWPLVKIFDFPETYETLKFYLY